MVRLLTHATLVSGIAVGMAAAGSALVAPPFASWETCFAVTVRPSIVIWLGFSFAARQSYGLAVAMGLFSAPLGALVCTPPWSWIVFLGAGKTCLAVGIATGVIVKAALDVVAPE